MLNLRSKPARRAATAAMAALVILATITLVSAQSTDSAPICSSGLLVDDFSHGGVSASGVSNSLNGRAYSEGGADPYPVANNQVLVPTGAKRLVEDIPCTDVSAYSGLAFKMDYAGTPPNLILQGFASADRCGGGWEPMENVLWNVGKYRRGDGVFFVPKAKWLERVNLPVMTAIVLADFTAQSGVKVGPIWFECAAAPGMPALNGNGTTTATATDATTASPIATTTKDSTPAANKNAAAKNAATTTTTTTPSAADALSTIAFPKSPAAAAAATPGRTTAQPNAAAAAPRDTILTQADAGSAAPTDAAAAEVVADPAPSSTPVDPALAAMGAGVLAAVAVGAAIVGVAVRRRRRSLLTKKRGQAVPVEEEVIRTRMDAERNVALLHA
ncbi:hypothetical protein AMAG_08652 [Allomyces macrogynus ATCC 38327]|uniref:Uncharacterized protein n=1 Tax=Allomyces macrogynus (strain ATCC 38327) TaxID=578462 RepID=A0A0L0SMD4_ALLM3|nr:hypothetical protein AMAG_08652 [Allomyces macrogynus ATCC 38327]|eukprot:KNE63539.1 hypothetical protein AMAG_08652 [Allomyces macrogynus ATCC 38327]